MGQQRTILSIRKETRQMFKKLNKMKIGARLKKSFRQIILIFGILSALVVVIMLYTINNYGTILDNYAYPQGDIAMAMNESAEVRAASRGIVGYDSDSLIESMKEQHEQAVKSFEEYLEKIRPTMITKEGTACMDAIDKAWAEYKEVDAKVIEVGATTDTAKSLQAQQMMTDEAAPKYQALNDALQKLMALNISLGNAERAQLRTIMIAALTIIIIVIAVSTIYSNSLSVAISKSIAKNHGLSPKSGNPLSYSSVKTEINGYRPIYMQMQRKSDEGKKYHALTLIGYSSSKYTVLNPWQSSSITLTKKDSGSDVTYVTGTRTYKWYTSIYNWK